MLLQRDTLSHITWFVTVTWLVVGALGARLPTRRRHRGEPLKPTLAFVLLYVALDRLAGGNSIWPGAILHAVIQSGIKILVDDAAAFQSLAIAWVALGLAAPWLFFAVLRDRDQSMPKPGSIPSRDARAAR